MNQSQFPTGWNVQRVERVITHYDEQTEDETALEDQTQTIMEIPRELVPAVRELLAKHLQTRA